MSIYNIRLNAFESTKEKDITDILDELNSHHQLNQFIANSIRYVMQNKDAFRQFTKEQLNSYGIDYDRMRFFSELTKQITDMKHKVNSIYEMASKVYILAQMNKKLGLEVKADNLLSASFVIEKQITDLENILGTSINESYASSKLEDAHKKAKDAFELILESYDDIITEISTRMNQPVQVVQQVVQNAPVEEKVEKHEETIEKPVEIKTIDTSTEDELGDDDYIDFGNADISALEKFMQGSI